MRANVTLQPSSKQNAEQPEINRRKFLKWTIASTSSLLLAPELLNAAFLNERYLFFYNPNTSETVRRVYWTPRDGYVQESAARATAVASRSR
jgi:hypothetical protein